jgi:prephenate dehydratase
VYGATVLQSGLEDHSENYTRFVLLAPEGKIPPGADKVSLVVRLPHRPGALHHALEPFARRGLSLLKIESRPVHGEPWQYRFYLDLQASAESPEVQAALVELRQLTEDCRILGCYRAATLPSPPLD